MTRCFSLLLALAGLIVITSVTSVNADDRRKRHPSPPKEARNREARLMLVPRLQGGLLVGEAADAFEGNDRGPQDKMFYGGGLSLEYYLRPASAVAVNFEAVWKSMPWEGISSVRTFTYSASWLYSFAPRSPSSVYLRPELGLISGSLPNYFPTKRDGTTSYKLGTHLFFRLGVGLFAYTASATNTRFELFYKWVFTDGAELEQTGREIDANVQGIGIEFGFGIPLKKR